MTARMDVAQRELGELFISGFLGKTLSNETAEFLSATRMGGVILFSKNYENIAQVTALIAAIQDRQDQLPLWISVDHEGGRVQRFREGFSVIPEALDITQNQSPKALFELSQTIASELKAVGININFAPVADIQTNPKNPIIGKRAFGSDAPTVEKMVSAFVRGHVLGGVQPCVKHFPGHGDTEIDSHFALPTVDTPLETLMVREFMPFRKGFKSGCNMVMTAHVRNPKLDAEFPATLSEKTLSILRDELKFSGLIISDDLEMQAITDHYGEAEAPIKAINAGCDLLIYRSEGACRIAYQACVDGLKNHKLDPEKVIQAAKRSKDLKARVLAL